MPICYVKPVKNLLQSNLLTISCFVEFGASVTSHDCDCSNWTILHSHNKILVTKAVESSLLWWLFSRRPLTVQVPWVPGAWCAICRQSGWHHLGGGRTHKPFVLKEHENTATDVPTHPFGSFYITGYFDLHLVLSTSSGRWLERIQNFYGSSLVKKRKPSVHEVEKHCFRRFHSTPKLRNLKFRGEYIL